MSKKRKRFTTDQPQSNVESMLNYAYAKDGRVFLRYGDGEKDIDLCDYISREAADKRCRPTSEEVMEGVCLECDCPFAILYVVATQAAELRERLKEFEDAEEEVRHGREETDWAWLDQRCDLANREVEQIVKDIFDEVDKCVIGIIEPSFSQLRDKYISKVKDGRIPDRNIKLFIEHGFGGKNDDGT